MTRMFHVTSVRNRDSIETHGLDWTRMSAVPGIAGSRRPEVDGIFLADHPSMAQFFVRMNNTGGPVDIWAVDDVDPADLVDSDSGFCYLPARIERHRLTLHDRDIPEPVRAPAVRRDDAIGDQAYRSRLTITLADGTELSDAEAHAFIAQRADG